MPDQIVSTAKDLWAILLAYAGLVAWFVRLESRARANSKDVENKADKREVERYREEFKEHVAAMKEQRAEDLAMHHRDNQAVQNQLNSIHKDIRELLQRTAK